MTVYTDEQITVVIRYRNHRGEVAFRHIVPLLIRFAATEWHPEPQWLLIANDLDKGGARRDFAVRDILEWITERDVSDSDSEVNACMPSSSASPSAPAPQAAPARPPRHTGPCW